MKLHQLPKIVRRKKRLGRGIGRSGAKSGRGMKGQRSRAGSHIRAGFEGGQTPLYMRLPKGRGMGQSKSSQIVKPETVTVAQLKSFPAGIVGPGQMRAKGLIHGRHSSVKIIGNFKLANKLTVRAHGMSLGARQSIEVVGGTVEIIAKKQ
jgi:large subunit ribosomal protein L15